MKLIRTAIAVLPALLLSVSGAALGQSPGQSPGQSMDQRGETLSLETAVAMVLRDNPLLGKAALDVEKSADRLDAARTRRLPSFELNLLESQTLTRLDFQFPRGIFGAYPATGPIPSEDTKIGTPRQPVMFLFARAAQPLSQFHRISLGLQLEATRGEAAREKLRAERQAAAEEVKRIYYEMLSLRSAIETSDENLKLYRELDRVAGEYVIEKVALKSESLDAKAQLAAEEYTALSLRNDLASRKERLNALLGRDIRTEFNLSPVTEAAIYEMDPAAALARALAQRPDVREARLQLKQAELDRRIKRAESIPDVSATFSYLRVAPVSVIPPNIVSVGVQLTWEPFDWGRRKRELAEKGRSLAQAELALRAVEARAGVEINGLFRKLQEARALLRVAQLTQEAAREKVRVAGNRFAEQAALLKDVLHAQSVMAESSRKYEQALLAFRKARAELEKAIGEE